MAFKILLTLMLASFSFGLAAMVYDATSDGISAKAAKVVTALYLWPLVVIVLSLSAFTISLIWTGVPNL